ncbi:hypothetical protein Goshw_002715, partial [Gossypium schwendimanii]|nr:hypothetical protein [Gossypium schwendimanii]
MRAPTESPDPAVQPTIPTKQLFQMIPDAYPSPFMYPNPYMFPFLSPMAGWSQCPDSSPFSVTSSGPPMYMPASHEGPSGSSTFYQSPSPYRFQTISSLVMQTPPQSLFYQGGSSSQHRQPDTLAEEPESHPDQPQPLPKARQRRNPVLNR